MWIDLYAPALEPDEITEDWLNLCMKSDDFYEALGHVSWARGGFLEFGSMIWATYLSRKLSRISCRLYRCSGSLDGFRKRIGDCS